MGDFREILQFQEAWALLQKAWNASAQHWNDSARRGFEKRYWQEVEQTVPRVGNDLAQVVAKCKHALETCP